MKIQIYTLFLFIVIFLSACIKGPEYSDSPEITFVEFVLDTVSQDGSDSLVAVIELTDGDGDIGSDTMLNVFFIDNRQNVVGETFRIPPIPEEGSGNGISARFTFRLEAPCCIYEDGTTCIARPQPFFDSLSYSIYVLDRAGNVSNTIESPSIYLRCN